MNHLTQSLRRLVAAALVLMTMPAFAQLSGTYTIDPNGTGTNNYASFTAAVSALTTSGVSGPVTFNVASGTYNEQISIGAITGSSATNSVTFQKAPIATSPAILTFAATSTANYTVQLAAASNLVFKDLTLANTANAGQTVGGIVEYGGTVSNISFINNTFEGNATSTSSSYGALRYGSTPSTGYASGVWKFIGNTFNNTSYSINVYGSTTVNADSLIATNNTINGTYYHLYAYYAKNVVFSNNTVNTISGYNGYCYVYYPSTSVVYNNNTMTGMAYGMYSAVNTANTGSLTYVINDNNIGTNNTATTQYGFYISGSSAAANAVARVSIKNNNIVLAGTSTCSGIYASYVNANAATPSEISNNMISCNGGTTSTIYGFYPNHVANMDFVHNSIHVINGSATGGRAMYINRSTSGTAFAVGGLNIQNNIISNVGPGYAIEVASTTNTAAMIGAMSNNAYQGNATNPLRFGTTNYTTIADWQTATTKEAGSVLGQLVFFSNQDLHVQNALANNVGTPLASVTTDIDGQTRSTTTPDAGADEYSPLACISYASLSSSNVGSSTATVSWTTTNTPVSYKVRYRTLGGSWTTMTQTATTANLTGLQGYTTYEFQVKEFCSAADSSIWSGSAQFTTAVAPNWTENFTTYPPAGWSEAAGRALNPTVFTSTTSSNWANGNYGNVAGTANGLAARVNLWSTNHFHWMMTPTIDIPVNNNAYNIEYDLALTTYSGANATFLGVDDTLSLFVSLDNGATWNKSNSVRTYTAADTISPTGIHEVIPVPSAWKGQLIKLAWYSQSTLSNADNYVFVDNFSVVSSLPCADSNQCDFTVNMVDSWGDGWNGNTVSFVQGGNVVATVGSGFTSGASATATITLCSGSPVTIQVGNFGSYSSEVGFSLVSPDGITLFNRAPGASFTASTVFGTVNNVACFTPACPVTDTLTVAGETTCGNSSVTFAAAAANPNNTVIWLNTDSATVGSGNSFTTPVLSATTTYLAGVFADDNALAAAHMGAPATLTGGFGNFTNGQWFTAQTPITIDSITVISNGASTFSVRISEAGGSIATGNSGALLQQSQWITVPAAGTHKVAVGLKIMPGTYFMNFTWQTGSGLLHRATAGATYPYTIAGVASIDSVQFGSATSQVRVYYAYDWVVSEGCVGPLTQATATWAAVPSTAIPYSVDFNSGLPCNWSATSNTSQNWNVVATYGTSSLNGSSFAFLDDDAAGFSAPAVDASLLSPSVNTLGYDSVTVSFDHYYRHLTGQKGFVEAYNGTAWVVLDSFMSTQGSWAAPQTKNYDVTSLANANFQVRFRFNDGSGVYGWYWAVDNFEIDGNVLPCTNVRVAVTTDIYGSEVTWSIRDINTGIVWATGGPYADVTPYNAAAATHIDTLCLPDNGTYEFQINDSYGDGLFDGTNTGTYTVDKLCSWGWNNVITGSGAQPYGSTTNPPSYDSVVFDMNCIQLKNVTFQVDMNQVTAGFTTPEVNGFWNNWCGNCNAMSDANGDGIWEVTIPLEVGTTQEFKYSADAWTIQEMNDPTAPCTNGNATYTNRVLVVPAADTTLPVVCWSSCYGCTVDVTLQVNMAWEVANNAISADGIHVAGDFQGWNPGATMMTDANSDGIYEVTINVPANSSIQYKFINGNSWGQDEPVPGACAVTGTTNRGATFAYGDSTMAPVCFGKCTDCMASLDEPLQNVSLFPNPTRGQFNLARMDAASEVEVSVLDLQGKLLTVATWNAGAESLGIDLSNFANGVYMVRLTSEEGSRTLRVSVQK